MHGLPHLIAILLIVTQVSGCSLLDLLLGSGFEPDPDEPLPFPTAEATFTTGAATIALGDETIVLDEVLDGSSVSEFGYSVTWENEDGWYLQVYGYPEDLGVPGGGASVSLHLIQDSEHLVVLDPSRCITTTDGVGDTGITGTVTCRGLQWGDFFSSYLGGIGGFPKPIESTDPFDAEISFEAH